MWFPEFDIGYRFTNIRQLERGKNLALNYSAVTYATASRLLTMYDKHVLSDVITFGRRYSMSKSRFALALLVVLAGSSPAAADWVAYGSTNWGCRAACRDDGGRPRLNHGYPVCDRYDRGHWRWWQGIEIRAFRGETFCSIRYGDTLYEYLCKCTRW